MSAEVEIEGIQETLDKLEALPGEVQTAIGERWAEDVSAYVADFARTIAPKRTGKLASEINTRVMIRSPTFIRIVVEIRQYRFGRRFYPKFQEFGTKHITPKRFLRRALEAGQNASGPMLLGIVRRHLREVGE